MSKITFGSLNLKVKDEIKTFIFNEKEIEVKQYLGAEEKNKMLNDILNSIFTDHNYNCLLADAFFYLNLVYYYTNLTFTEKQKSDELKLFDLIESSGFLEKFLEVMNEDEFNTVYEGLKEQIDIEKEYLFSITNAFDAFSDSAPDPSLIENLEDVDLEQMKNILAIAKEAGIGLDN